MRHLKTLGIALGLFCMTVAARADDPTQHIGRILGFGWGDGYHSQRTWPLNSSAPCTNCSSSPQSQPRPTPAAPPKEAGPKTEPNSPSDRPVLKTGLLRYPITNQPAQRR